MTRIAHSNNIPTSVEYLGLNEWAVRWDVKIDTSKQEDDDIIHYVYSEEIYNEEPNYGVFVSNRIRDVYSKDEEDALKSNVLNVFLTPDSPKYESIIEEWKEFEQVRNRAKEFGRQIFNI